MGFSNYHFSKNPLKTVGIEGDPLKPKLKETSSTYSRTDEGATLTKTFTGKTDKSTSKPLTKEQKAASTAYWSSLTPEEKQEKRDAAKAKKAVAEYKVEYKKLPYHEPTIPTQIEQADIGFVFPEEKPKPNGNENGNGNGKKKSNGIKKKISSWLIEKKDRSKSQKRLKCAKGGGTFSTKSKTSCSF